MTSTASETLRMSALASLTRIASGVGLAGSIPRTSRSANRSQAVGVGDARRVHLAGPGSAYPGGQLGVGRVGVRDAERARQLPAPCP